MKRAPLATLKLLDSNLPHQPFDKTSKLLSDSLPLDLSPSSQDKPLICTSLLTLIEPIAAIPQSILTPTKSNENDNEIQRTIKKSIKKTDSSSQATAGKKTKSMRKQASWFKMRNRRLGLKKNEKPQKSCSINLDFSIEPKKLLSELLREDSRTTQAEIVQEQACGDAARLGLSSGDNKFLNKVSLFEEEKEIKKPEISVICLNRLDQGVKNIKIGGFNINFGSSCCDFVSGQKTFKFVV